MENTVRQEKIKNVMNRRQEGVIVLENIADPHNAAAVWRSADALGFQKIYLVYSKEEIINPKKIGKASSSSANKWLSFKIFGNIEDCYKELKKEGFKIFATVLDDEAKKIEKVDFGDKKIAIVMGNEHRGLSKKAIEGADEKIYIPMEGMVQSMNISVSAAIFMYEASRQRKGKEYKLEKTEVNELEKEFCWLK
ncbi:RNA methyltransferase [Patescibacteria group bacterium]|nr:RNA methyltransferase [Patescibacteria group bacterium]